MATFGWMNKAQYRKREEVVFSKMHPRILDHLKSGDDPVAFAETLSSESEVDTRTIFKWIQTMERDRERRRRRIAGGGMVFIWIGVAVLATLVLAWLFAWTVGTGVTGALLATVGIISIAVGASVVSMARRWAYRWHGK